MRHRAKNVERVKTCIKYLRQHDTIPAAQVAAKMEGFAASFSVWMGALSDMLEAGERPGCKKTTPPTTGGKE